MIWAIAGLTWTIAAMTLVSLRYSVSVHLRRAVATAALALMIVSGWQWCSGDLTIASMRHGS